MTWEIAGETDSHFHVKSNAGVFKVSKASLSPAAHERMRQMAKGGKVQGLDDGGAAGDVVANPYDGMFVTPAPAARSQPDAQDVALAQNLRNGAFGAASTAMDVYGVSGLPGSDAASMASPVMSAAEEMWNKTHPAPTATETSLASGLRRAVPGAINAAQTLYGLSDLPGSGLAASLPGVGDIVSQTVGDVAGALDVNGKPAQQGTTQGQSATPNAQPTQKQANAGAQFGIDVPSMLGVGGGSGAAGDIARSTKQAQQAALGVGAAQQQAADAEAAEIQRQNQLKQAWMQTYQQHEAERNQASQKMIDDIQNERIDPNHFWADKSGFDKVRMGIGLVLGGIGSGLTGQPNVAAQFIQQAIARDMEAQKANLSKKETLFGYFRQKLGDDRAAELMTHSVLSDIAANEIKAAATRAGGNVNAQQAQLLSAQLGQQGAMSRAQVNAMEADAAIKRMDLAQRQMMFRYTMSQMGGGQHGEEPGYVPSGTPPPMLSEFSLKGKAEQEKAKGEMRVNLPELGEAAHTYAPPDVAKDVNKTLPEYLNMEHNLAVMERAAKQHSLKINMPGTAASKDFDVAAQALNLSMNRLMGQNRFTDTEDHHYQQMVARPREFLIGAGGPAAIKALRQQIQAKRLGEYQRLGIRMGPRPQETPLTPANS